MFLNPILSPNRSQLEVGDTGNFDIDTIPSKYRASIADINGDTNTFSYLGFIDPKEPKDLV